MNRFQVNRNRTPSSVTSRINEWFGYKGGKSIVEKANIHADELDFIIVATITPDSMMPSTAARVQANIGAIMLLPLIWQQLAVALSSLCRQLKVNFFRSLPEGLCYRKWNLIKSSWLVWSFNCGSFRWWCWWCFARELRAAAFLAESQYTDGSRGKAWLVVKLVYLHLILKRRSSALLDNGWSKILILLFEMAKSIKYDWIQWYSSKGYDYLLLHQPIFVF